LQSPGSIEERRASRLRRDKGHRVPFLWFVSLGKQRNEQKDKIYPGADITWQSQSKNLKKKLSRQYA
jgi:hypothetical protein